MSELPRVLYPPWIPEQRPENEAPQRFTKARYPRRTGRAAHGLPAAGVKQTARAEAGNATGTTSDAERCEWDP